MKPPPKPDYSGVFTDSIRYCYDENFREIWGGRYSHAAIIQRQKKRLKGLKLKRSSLRTAVGYLFRLQYISDMKVTYPRNVDIDDPMKLGSESQVGPFVFSDFKKLGVGAWIFSRLFTVVNKIMLFGVCVFALLFDSVRLERSFDLRLFVNLKLQLT